MDPLDVGLNNLQPGHWYEYNNSRLESVNPCPGAANCDNQQQQNIAGIMLAWGGAAFDPVSNRLFVWGGGHNDYGGNELYAFSVETGTWERLTDPSSAPFADGDGAYYPDGLPQSRHTYNHLQFDPVRNEFLSLAAAATFGPASTSHRNVDAFDLDTLSWVRKASSPDNDGIIAGGASAYDSKNDMFWLFDRSDKVKRFNPATNTWAEFGSLVASIYTTADVDTSRDLLVYTGSGDLRYMDLNNPSERSVTISTGSSQTVAEQSAPGFVYDPSQQLYVGWGGTNERTSVYTLNPDTWGWTRFTAAGTNTVTPTASPNAGTNGRFRYIPEFNAFILVNATDENVYLYKMSAGVGTPVDPPPSVTLTADPAAVDSGTSSTLTWTVENSTSCTASGDWSGSKNTGGGSESTGALSANATYTLSCSGPGGTDTDSAAVTVTALMPPTVDLTATPDSVTSGETTQLTWRSTNATSCSASGGWSGTQVTENQAGVTSAALNSDTTFTLTCNGSGGSTSSSATVTVENSVVPDPVVTLTASSTDIESGDAVTLTWSVTNAVLCQASSSDQGDWFGRRAVSGGSQVIMNIIQDTAYALDCINSEGVRASDSKNVTVGGAIDPPTVMLTATPNPVISGGSLTLSWQSSNTISCEASGDWNGAVALSGSQVFTGVTQSQSYVLTCTGDDGGSSDSVNVTVTDPPPVVVTNNLGGDGSGGGGAVGLWLLLALQAWTWLRTRPNSLPGASRRRAGQAAMH